MREKVRPLTCAIVFFLSISMIAALFPATVTAVEEPPRDQTLVMLSCVRRELVAHNVLMSEPAYLTSLMYPSLYLYSPYLDEWIPYLAKNYIWLDKITLLVTIRDEAKWWDGTPITAEDVEYSLELGKKYNVTMYTPHWTYLENVKVINNKIVAFYLNQSTLNYFQALNVLWQPLILPKARWQNLEAQYGAALTTEFKDDVPGNIVGGGPYRLLASLTDRIYYQRVDDWWGKDIFGLPNPKWLACKICMDTAASNADLAAGVIDVSTHMIPEIWTMFPTGVRTYYPNPPYFLSRGPFFLYINYLKKPLDNPTVRRAIAHALPTADMISMYYYNYSVPAAAVPIIHTGPATKYINQSLIAQYGWTYNITRAKEILDDANIKDIDGDTFREMPDGTELSGFTIQVPYGWPDWMGCCELIAQNLNSTGIGCTAEFPDFSVWWTRLGEKNWDFVIGWADASPGFNHPWNAFRSTMDPRLSHPSGNWENYKNTAVEARIDAIPKESDPEALKGIYNQLQEIWLEDIPGVPLFYGATWYEYSEEHWVGWPNEENGFWFANVWTWPENMPTLFTVVPKGETPVQPSWVADTKFSTDEIYEALSAAPAHGVISTTKTVTLVQTIVSTATVVSTTTTEVAVPTMDITSVAGAGIVALIVGLAVGWLVASQKKKSS